MTGTHGYSSPRQGGIIQGPSGLLHDWPFVAPAMAAMLTSAAIVIALMFFAERSLLR